MSSYLSHQIANGSESAAHLSRLEAAHHEVESCVSRFEAIIAGLLSDIGKFSAARLRLRQANMARTQVVLDACRYLIRSDDPQPQISDLQHRALEHSQSISKHVQSWDVQRIQNDWDGYCRATRRILRSGHEIVALEKRLLCSPLRDRLRC